MKRNSIIENSTCIIVICLILVLCFSCKPEKLASSCSINGKVTESNNAPVEGAIVKISESVETSTQSNGEYHIDNVNPDKYNFSVSKNGYSSIQQNIDVNLAQQEQNFVINKIIALFGKDTLINITISSATAIGFINDLGYLGHIINYGHCWSSMNPTPTIYDNKTIYDTLNNPTQFQSALSGLSPNTTYYVRAYASNSLGTAYGNVVSFITTSSSVPTVTTNAITNITQSAAFCGGNVTNEGSTSVTARGVCWGTSPNPVLTPSHFTTEGTGSGTFTSEIMGINSNTTYYIRAYATNSGGTAYGNEITVVLWVNQSGPTVTDIDGNTYNSVKIGNQIWMKQNLKTTHYRDGSAIPLVTSTTSWPNLTTGAYCNYNNDINNVSTYGRLYNFYAVIDSRNLCPLGWHVSSDVEYTVLFDYLGGQAIAGNKLREAGSTHWTSPNPGATNESGFTALPGGLRNYPSDGEFGEMGSVAEFWTASSFSATEAWDMNLFYSENWVTSRSIYKSNGFSVRCIKN